MSHSLLPFDDSLRSIVNDFWNRRSWPSIDDSLASSINASFPRVDISETDANIVVKADIPGVKAENVSVDIEGALLTISGSTEREHEDKGKRYYRYERSNGSFSRSFTLPCEINEDNITAETKHGVLTITLPKVVTKAKKKVNIKAEDE